MAMDHMTASGPLLTIPEERRQSERECAEAAERYDRQTRRETIVLVAVCWGWVLLGSWCLALSVRTPDMMISQILERVGPAVGFGGIYFTVLGWLVRRSERGDFG
jgi:hypothetical protein